MNAFTTDQMRGILDFAQTVEDHSTASVKALVDVLIDASGAAWGTVCELDVVRESTVVVDEHGPGLDQGTGAVDAEAEAELERVFWAVFWASACSYTEPGSAFGGSTGSRAVAAPEDFYGSWRSYARSPMHRRFGAVVGLGHYVIVPLTSEAGLSRRIVLHRELGDLKFTEADLVALRLLQPHLDAVVGRALAGDAPWQLLSPRELQILAYLRAGLSTADTARLLWVEPGTVRKHLENAFAKLGVHSRTAAVARVFGAPDNPAALTPVIGELASAG